MEARLNPVQLLQWYMDVGADEATGDKSIDRLSIVEKTIPASPASIIPIALPNQQPATEALLIGAVEASGVARDLAAKAGTLEELKSALENFQGLSLKRTATQMVSRAEIRRPE